MIHIKKGYGFTRYCSHRLLIPIYFQAIPQRFKKHIYTRRGLDGLRVKEGTIIAV